MDSLLEQTGFELQVPPRTTDCWLAPARHPTGCTEASPLPWRGCGFIGHSAGSDPRTAFEPDNGRSVLAVGTALHAPHLPFAIPAGIGSIGWFSAVHSLSLNIPWAVALSQVGAMPRQVSGTFPQTRRASSLGQWFGDQSRSPRKNSPIRNPGCRSRTRTAVGH
jgi:hypothetical protein